jgi:hypothetical protein
MMRFARLAAVALAAAAFAVPAVAHAGAATFAGQPVTVSFDDLRVTADSIVCP